MHNRSVAARRDRDAYVRLAAVIRNLRRAHDWTQADLARMLDAHQTYVSKIELGERRLDVIEAAALARVLEVSVDELLRRAGID